MPEFDSYNPSHPKMFEADCLNSGIAGSVDYTPGGSHSFRYDLYAGSQDGCLIRFLLSVCRSHFESFPSDRDLIHPLQATLSHMSLNSPTLPCLYSTRPFFHSRKCDY